MDDNKKADNLAKKEEASTAPKAKVLTQEDFISVCSELAEKSKDPSTAKVSHMNELK